MSGPSVKVLVEWLDNSKTERIGADAVLLLFTALGHSARQTSNGVVERDQLRKLWPVADIDDAVNRLIKAGQVEERGDDLYLVNWRDFILEADEVDRIKEMSRTRDERRRRHNRGDHSMCQPRYCSAAPRENSRDSERGKNVGSHVSHADPTRTYPDRPLGREGEDGRGSAPGSAGAPPGPAPGKQIAPHAWVWPEGGHGDDEEGPCASCGRELADLVHDAHVFQPGERFPNSCDWCGASENHRDHDAYATYIMAVEVDATWPTAEQEAEWTAG